MNLSESNVILERSIIISKEDSFSQKQKVKEQEGAVVFQQFSEVLGEQGLELKHFLDDLSLGQCGIINHDKIQYLCLEKFCEEESRLVCSVCLQKGFHRVHRKSLIKGKQFWEKCLYFCYSGEVQVQSRFRLKEWGIQKWLKSYQDYFRGVKSNLRVIQNIWEYSQKSEVQIRGEVLGILEGLVQEQKVEESLKNLVELVDFDRQQKEVGLRVFGEFEEVVQNARNQLGVSERVLNFSGDKKDDSQLNLKEVKEQLIREYEFRKNKEVVEAFDSFFQEFRQKEENLEKRFNKKVEEVEKGWQKRESIWGEQKEILEQKVKILEENLRVEKGQKVWREIEAEKNQQFLVKDYQEKEKGSLEKDLIQAREEKKVLEKDLRQFQELVKNLEEQKGLAEKELGERRVQFEKDLREVNEKRVQLEKDLREVNEKRVQFEKDWEKEKEKSFQIEKVLGKEKEDKNILEQSLEKLEQELKKVKLEKQKNEQVLEETILELKNNQQVVRQEQEKVEQIKRQFGQEMELQKQSEKFLNKEVEELKKVIQKREKDLDEKEIKVQELQSEVKGLKKKCELESDKLQKSLKESQLRYLEEEQILAKDLRQKGQEVLELRQEKEIYEKERIEKKFQFEKEKIQFQQILEEKEKGLIEIRKKLEESEKRCGELKRIGKELEEENQRIVKRESEEKKERNKEKRNWEKQIEEEKQEKLSLKEEIERMEMKWKQEVKEKKEKDQREYEKKIRELERKIDEQKDFYQSQIMEIEEAFGQMKRKGEKEKMEENFLEKEIILGWHEIVESNKKMVQKNEENIIKREKIDKEGKEIVEKILGETEKKGKIIKEGEIEKEEMKKNFAENEKKWKEKWKEAQKGFQREKQEIIQKMENEQQENEQEKQEILYEAENRVQQIQDENEKKLEQEKEQFEKEKNLLNQNWDEKMLDICNGFEEEKQKLLLQIKEIKNYYQNIISSMYSVSKRPQFTSHSKNLFQQTNIQPNIDQQHPHHSIVNILFSDNKKTPKTENDKIKLEYENKLKVVEQAWLKEFFSVLRQIIILKKPVAQIQTRIVQKYDLECWLRAQMSENEQQNQQIHSTNKKFFNWIQNQKNTNEDTQRIETSPTPTQLMNRNTRSSSTMPSTENSLQKLQLNKIKIHRQMLHASDSKTFQTFTLQSINQK